MNVNIKIPQIGDTEGPYEIEEWFVKNNSLVNEGDDLYSLEIGKAVNEIKAPCSGKLCILTLDGEVNPGDIIGIINS